MARTCYDGAHAGTEAGRPAWSLWLAALGFLAGGLAVTLAVTRPLTADVLVSGAARTVEGFAACLRVQVGLDSLQTELLAVVDQTMQPAQASLWLRPPLPRSSLSG